VLTTIACSWTSQIKRHERQSCSICRSQGLGYFSIVTKNPCICEPRNTHTLVPQHTCSAVIHQPCPVSSSPWCLVTSASGTLHITAVECINREQGSVVNGPRKKPESRVHIPFVFISPGKSGI
jgi:hypothetical protein